MISSIDTYVYNEVKTKLTAILKNTDILSESLKSIDKHARDQFIAAYGGPKPKKPVEISYQFPNQKEKFDARVVVQLGEAQEEGGGIGSITDDYDFREGETIQENSKVVSDGDRLYIEGTKLLGKDISVSEISFSKQDDMKIEGNRLTFSANGNLNLVGMPVQLNYVERLDIGDEEAVGLKKGFSSREVLEITPLSNNIDTARCLDILLKVVFIIMLDTLEEKTGIQLQSKSFGAMQNLMPSEDSLDSLVYARPITVSYLVVHSVDFDIIQRIKQVILKGVSTIG